MPPPRTGKPRSLTSLLDAKVLGLVRQYIDDAVDDGNTSIFHKKTGTLSLGTSELYQYIASAGGGNFQRTRKALVEKSIERAIEVINEEQEKPAKKKSKKAPKDPREPGDEFDDDGEGMAMGSDFEGVDIGDLVEIKDTNAANKRITEIWGIKRAQSVDRGTPPPPTASSTRATSVAPTTTLKPIYENTTTMLPPTEATNGDATAYVSPKKRKEKSSSNKEGKEGPSTKRRKGDKGESRAPPSNLSLADLGGLDDVISDILELIGLPLTHPEVYTHTGVAPPRGVLLHGPPGCGKTMIANAIAGEIGLPFISVSAPSIVSGMSGESEKQLRDLFDEAREKAPCILFLDEIDAITPKRESAQREMERRIVAQMLTCMDDLTLEKTGGKPVMIIGATNRPDSLDPALRRAGRFDREICLGVPDEAGREKILKVLSKKLRLSGDFDFRKLAKMTPGFVGADLNALTAAAGVCAIKRIFHTLKDIVPLAAVADAVEAGDTPALVTPTEETDLPTSQPDPDSSAMDLDIMDQQLTTPATTLANRPAHTSTTSPETNNIPTTTTSTDPRVTTLHHFLTSFPSPLTPTQLAPLSITLNDFLSALPKIQPSSKREGFATVPDVTWADIGALHSIRVELQMAIVQPIKHPELYASVGITAPTGVLLWGPPGCGKTLLAKAVANESKANFISVRGPELLNKYVGESERAVRQVFTRARASTPCVIFFDELDALVPPRGDSLSDASSRVVNTLLTELDGLSDRSGVYVVGATNRPDAIDPAMLRPGRLDKPLLIDLPTPDERVEIIRTLISRNKTPIGEDVDVVALGRDDRCEGFSGADLAALVREAATGALRGALFGGISEGLEPGVEDVREAGKIKVRMADFDSAWGQVKPSVSRKQAGQYKVLASRFGS